MLKSFRFLLRGGLWASFLLLCANVHAQQDLTVDNQTITLGGVHSYRNVRVINGGKILVPNYDGSDRINTGNLQIRAESIYIDETSSIRADGAGYQPVLCDNGAGPNSASGGRGGCAVRDSGGGGAHFGRGGRGTKDCFIVAPADSCQFPQEFEESCGVNNGSSCSLTPNCYNNDALPSIAGVAYQHSIYEIEFGSAGGDKGCLDSWDSCSTAGAGGGRIVLAAVTDTKSGMLDIRGRVSAKGFRGCGHGNDSAGGGAGGSLLLVGDQVQIAANANISAAGGLGGDTLANANPSDPENHCPSCAQGSGTCDDCGGGGGGGIISVLSGVPATIESTAAFNVAGAVGGTCTICKGEAGGQAGELQLSGVYVGEVCDGYDNDFDGQIDEDLGSEQCGTGACQSTVDNCTSGLPNDCVPQAISSCQPALSDTRSRFLVIMDTSASMLTDLSATPTFGDGSAGHEGLDTNGDNETNDSRLYKAKQALTKVINAYPEIDFGLARFSQKSEASVNCQLAHWFECANICCSYDNPTNNTGGTPPSGACSLTIGSQTIDVEPTSNGDECINYAGSCGEPRRGADILVGFEQPINQSLMWLDHQETNFDATTTEGDFCNFVGGGDCELRGTGPTPLAGALQSAEAYLKKIRAEDRVSSCRRYAVILLTDGTETCQGNPVQAATDLLANVGVETYVIGFSVLASEQSALNQIANAGSTSNSRNAFFVGDEQQLAATIAGIVADSVVFESCNNLDDDCDLLIDEDFPLKGQPCNNGQLGECYAEGTYICKADGSGVECQTNGASPSTEICDGKDNDCDGAIDEGLTNCVPCKPKPEVCNGVDDDCDGEIDEDLQVVDCGKDVGECNPGKTLCVNGVLICDGGTGPTTEVCNNKDDDCDGNVDGMAQACYPYDSGCDLLTGICQGTCALGTEICTTGAWGNCVGARGPDEEICDGVDNNCDGNVDEQAECPGGSQCIEGQCSLPCSTGEFVCPTGQICKDGWCIIDPCDSTECEKISPNHICIGGECTDTCEGVSCGDGEECQRGLCVDITCYSQGCPDGQVCVQKVCVDDPCANTSCANDEFCQDGQCLKLCTYIECPEGQSCQVVEADGKYSTECVDDPCADVNCNSGYECVDGECVALTCSGVKCDKGEICVQGKCEKDLCEVTTCPSGYYCKDGNCYTDAQASRILVSGRGGFACNLSASNDSGGMSFFLLLILGLLAIRRKEGR